MSGLKRRLLTGVRFKTFFGKCNDSAGPSFLSRYRIPNAASDSAKEFWASSNSGFRIRTHSEVHRSSDHLTFAAKAHRIRFTNRYLR